MQFKKHRVDFSESDADFYLLDKIHDLPLEMLEKIIIHVDDFRLILEYEKYYNLDPIHIWKKLTLKIFPGYIHDETLPPWCTHSWKHCFMWLWAIEYTMGSYIMWLNHTQGFLDIFFDEEYIDTEYMDIDTDDTIYIQQIRPTPYVYVISKTTIQHADTTEWFPTNDVDIDALVDHALSDNLIYSNQFPFITHLLQHVETNSDQTMYKFDLSKIDWQMEIQEDLIQAPGLLQLDFGFPGTLLSCYIVDTLLFKSWYERKRQYGSSIRLFPNMEFIMVHGLTTDMFSHYISDNTRETMKYIITWYIVKQIPIHNLALAIQFNDNTLPIENDAVLLHSLKPIGLSNVYAYLAKRLVSRNVLYNTSFAKIINAYKTLNFPMKIEKKSNEMFIYVEQPIQQTIHE